MTATGEEPELRPMQPAPVSPDSRRRSAEAVRQVCPYLVAAEGGWRGVQPIREHRCGATLPMAAPAVAKQRDVCLGPSHATCATYRAARDLELASPGALAPGAAGGFWPETRSTVLALEPARGRITAIPGTPGRAGGQALLVGLMVLAFLVLVIARTSPPSAGGSTPSLAAGVAGSASPAATSTSPAASSSSGPSAPVDGGASPSSEPATASPVASGSAVPSPSGHATPSPRATATPVPANAKRYKVKSGDTLSAIAARYNTTVKKLKAANGLTSNIIHVGQVLVIP